MPFNKELTLVEDAWATRTGLQRLIDYCDPKNGYGGQRALSELSGIAASTISAMVTGRRPITIYYAIVFEIATEGKLRAIQLLPHYAYEITLFKELK